jgi:23S rRNA (guanosine2251-2'-O)-methyltransferase
MKTKDRIVIGLHSALEVLKVRPSKITEIWLKEGADRSHDHKPFIDFAKSRRIRLHIKPLAALDKVAPSHQGVCLMVSETPEIDLGELDTQTEKNLLIVALDEISDPHNVGAILRTAWLMGAKALLVPDLRSAHLTPSVTKVACGAAEHVPVVVCNNLANELTYLKDKGFWIYGLAGEGSTTLWKTRFHEHTILVVGSEDKGLRSTTAKACDALVAIPQTVSDASFNASVATGIAIYEVVRQHKNP